jgi:group I intron endonuclease
MIGIYKITSPSNNIYIGQSINLERRLARYKSNLNSSKGQIRLNRSFIKYGVENHLFEIVLECSIEELNIKERYYQELFDCIENGLNLRYTKTNDKSGKMSAESIAKMVHYKRNMTPEHRLNLSIANRNKEVMPTMLGKTHSEESKKKISQSLTGKVRSKEHCESIRKSKLGIIVSDETKAKKSKPVLQYDLQGNFIAKYFGIKEAARKVGISDSLIIDVCKGKYPQGKGFVWKYENC